MTYYSIKPPYDIFTDSNGDPLEAGYIYIGTANLNPITNPITVTWDLSGLYPAAQPIRTIAGYPSRNGSPGNIYVNAGEYGEATTGYSILTQNSRQETVSYIANKEFGTTPDSVNIANIAALRLISSNSQPLYVRGYYATGDGGQGIFEWSDGQPVGTYVDNGGTIIVPTGGDGSGAWLRQYEKITVEMFGAKGDGVTDDTAAIQSAIDTVEPVYLGQKTYLIDSQLALDGGKTLIGINNFYSILDYTDTSDGILITNGINILEKFSINTTSGATSGVKLEGASSNILNGVAVTGNPAVGFWLYSDDTAAQTDWNTLHLCAVNTAVLPILLEAQTTGAVNSNVFSGVSNYRTSAAAGGTVCYLNGGGNGTIGNNFYDSDLSNYGGAGSKSVVIDGPTASQNGFYNLTIDTNANNTGITLGSGVYATKIIGGTHQAGISVVQNNTGLTAYDVIMISTLNFIQTIEPQTWQTPTLLNSWVDYGGTEATAEYFKDSCQIVHIKGTIKSGTITPGDNIFILPAGYRPLETHIFQQYNGAGNLGTVGVAANGAVYVAQAAVNTILSIDCTFLAEQ